MKRRRPIGEPELYWPDWPTEAERAELADWPDPPPLPTPAGGLVITGPHELIPCQVDA